MPETHYDPNIPHPAEAALKELLENVRTAIAGSTTLPRYLDGEGLISVPLSSEQLMVLQGQVRTLRSIEQMILERYPGVTG
jgi:hypothetical protein